MKKSISIIGAGWLGEALGLRLLQAGWTVRATTRSADKAARLRRLGMQAFAFDAARDPVPEACWDSPEILLTIPPSSVQPGARSATDLDPRPYADLIQGILDQVPQGQAPRITYTSSTSVYGNPIGTVEEGHPPSPERSSGKMVLAAENCLQDSSLPWVILRLGGLVGGQRAPIRYLAGRQNIPQGSAPVNLLHLEDAIGICRNLLDSDVQRQIFNAVSPGHPSRAAYYGHRATQLGLAPPSFQAGGAGKSISSEKIIRALGYQFQFPDPMEFPVPTG